MTEAELQRGVIELARLLGFMVAHFRAAQTATGWRTPVQADGKGFPDLVLAGHGRVLFVELKGPRGRVSDEQEAWLEVLEEGPCEVYGWTPESWTSGKIERILRGRG